MRMNSRSVLCHNLHYWGSFFDRFLYAFFSQLGAAAQTSQIASVANQPRWANTKMQTVSSHGHQSKLFLQHQGVLGNRVNMDDDFLGRWEKLEPSDARLRKARKRDAFSSMQLHPTAPSSPPMQQTMEEENRTLIKESWFDLSPDALAAPPAEHDGDYAKRQRTLLEKDGSSDVMLLKYAPFPSKLHRALQEAAEEGNGFILSWHSDGKGFRVHDQKLFVELIMPRYFGRQSKYKSFQRQLNLYGFVRQTDGEDTGYYRHERFRRDAPELCTIMKTQKVKGTTTKHKAARVTPLRSWKRNLFDGAITGSPRSKNTSIIRLLFDKPDSSTLDGSENNESGMIRPADQSTKHSQSDGSTTFAGRSFHPVDDRMLRILFYNPSPTTRNVENRVANI